MQGILLVDKPAKMSSFSVVATLRRRTGVQKIGHGGTLDPFATGLLVMLISRAFTRRADEFLCGDKEYTATLMLGRSTDTYDCEGETLAISDKVPSLEEVQQVLASFQGPLMQVPPMFSAKKIGGKRLYEIARQGKVVERAAVPVEVSCKLVRYAYPELEIHVTCSKGTYIRSLAFDIGEMLQTHAHLCQLRRVRSGPFLIEKAVSLQQIKDPATSLDELLLL